MSLIPVPEPTASYVTVSPYFESNAWAHSASIGATSVDPAPTSEPDASAALAKTVKPAVVNATTARHMNFLRFKVTPLSGQMNTRALRPSQTERGVALRREASDLLSTCVCGFKML